MSDIIHLLPDAVANQIAAGEVVSRPASAVKELIENAVDAGATQIQLIVKDAGRTLIQVVDNGKGMTFNDARLCFERHATSKISSANDIFTITTKGFRGEALASIAAIAQVELKTKQPGESVGTQLIIEGSEVKEHAPTATQDGTSIAVKNLFFNVPARRNFLKSDAIEFAHIEEEFNRVALIHHDIAFSLYHNGKLQLQLQPSNFKQRIINIFGTHFKDKLYPTEQETDPLTIVGFIAKPECSKKKKSEQYLFINNRFVKYPLLNYAIESAYSELIPQGNKPAYFIQLTIDPKTIDVNVSPTKVEVKLQNERLIFGFLNSAVKKSLGVLSLTPRLDFDYQRGMDVSNFSENKPLVMPSTGVNPNYNPFHSGMNQPKPSQTNISGWDNFLKELQTELVSGGAPSGSEQQKMTFETTSEAPETPETVSVAPYSYFFLEQTFLVLKLYKQLTIINIELARERILYENYLSALTQQPIAVQQSLFPETVTLSAANAELLMEIKDDLFKLGYDIEPLGKTQFAVNGTPHADDAQGEELQTIIERLVESYKANIFLYRGERERNVALSLAKQKKHRFKLPSSEGEVAHFVQQLLACQTPHLTPSGKKTLHTMPLHDVETLFT